MDEVATTQTADRPHGQRRRWIAGAVVLVLIALILWNVLTPKAPPRAPPPQIVRVAQAVHGDMPVILNELGTVTPTATVTVVPNQAVSGYLIDVPFHEGQDVEKDQLLAQIDPRPYEVLLQQAEGQLAKDQATLDQAKSDLERYTLLNKQKSIAEQTYTDQKFVVQQNEAAVKIDLANVAQYKLDISYCRITAPVAGRVGLRQVDIGNFVTGTSNTGIAVITTIKPITVQFTVAQNDLQKVVERFNTPDVKLPVTVYNSDNSKQIATGTLFAINNQMTTSTGTVTLRASFPNQDERLFPNEFVNVQLLVDTLHQAVLVPTTAVLSGAPGNYVYLVNKDDTVSVHKITLGPSDGKNTMIASGLEVGDTVVTDGTDRLSDGAKIRVAAAPEPQQTSSNTDPLPKKASEGGAPPAK
jgi:membrane fusion protein, multidrug efflux system